ncbi:MAG: large conductance mechanosensitive channel protein MscL [Bacteroidetes bacterium]|nr:MAG: large conductance mechanosensitive channel protein MscL [Bacteroidota bacterium]
MGFLKDFKDFAMRGNVVDLAVAVIIGGAFGAIVSSLVENIITPLLLAPLLKAAHAQDLDKLTWGAVKPGKFLSSVINFLLIAFVLFLIIRAAKSLEKKKTPPEPALTTTEKLLTEIRDELKKN